MYPGGRLWLSSVIIDCTDPSNPKMAGFNEGTPDYVIQQYYEDMETCKSI